MTIREAFALSPAGGLTQGGFASDARLHDSGHKMFWAQTLCLTWVATALGLSSQRRPGS